MPLSATLPPPSSAPHPDDDDDFDDEDDDEDMDMYDDDDPAPSAAALPPDDDLNSSPSSSTDDDDRIRSVNGSSSAAAAATTPILSLAASPLDSKRPKIEEERRSFSSIEERRLFQRLWTDEDEIVILQGFYEFTSQRGTTHHAHQHDTGPFYEQIKNRLQLDFTKNQLVEKIRRLKKKYRNIVARMASGREFAFKSPHERATYDISRKIWSGSVSKKGFDHDDDDHDDADRDPPSSEHRGKRGIKRPAANSGSDTIPIEVKSVPAIPVSFTAPVSAAPHLQVPVPMPIPAPSNSVSASAVEETVKNCFSPLVKDLVQYAVSGTTSQGLMGMGLMPLGFVGNLAGLGSKDTDLDGRWRKQQILELEVYSKRLELVQEMIKVKLEELRSLGG